MSKNYHLPIKKKIDRGRIPLYLPLERPELTGSGQHDKPTEKRGSTEVDYRV